MLKKFLLQLARSHLFGTLIGWFFAHCSFLVPIKRLYESETLLAFRHPQPSYPVQVLLVPKKAVRGLVDRQTSDAGLLLEILQTGQALAESLHLTHQGYQLILNAGAYQEVPQLHVHLISGSQAMEPPQNPKAGT
jgi:histidine triad (HIT) family protein